ncbi:mannan-binding lectin serine protease 2-like [Styela clava]
MKQLLQYSAYIALLQVLINWALLTKADPVVHLLTKEHGSIQSPNYPKDYGVNLDITWEITAKPGYKIIIYFTEFDVEDSYEEGKGNCVYDYVKILSGDKIIKTFCGSSSQNNIHAPVLEKQIETTGNKLTLQFVSDYSNDDPKPRGFLAHYKSVDRDECKEKELEVMYAFEDWDEIIYCNHQCHNVAGSYFCSCEKGFQLHSNKHTCTSSCQGIILTDDKGIITTSKYPVAYSKLADCDWTIKGKKGISIDIRYVGTFSIEKHFEEGCVYDWVYHELADGTKSERYCGTGKPNNGEWINTNSQSVKIMFHSDLTEEESGFKLEYKFNRVQCKKILIAPQNGMIISQSASRYEFEDVVKFACVKGFRIIGEKSITCLNNGKWSATEPVCQAIICDHPKDFVKIKHATRVILPTSFAYGATFTVACDGEYFEMVSGAASWICGDDAKWVPNSELLAPNDNNNVPECKPACGLKGNTRRLAFANFRRRRAVLKTATKFIGENVIVAAVVRGKPAKYGEWPWMALIDLFGSGLNTNEFCGGSLISARTVVTAAHCTSRTYVDRINVFLGVSERNYAGDIHVQKFKVAELYEHDKYVHSNFDNDIAVIILDKSAVIGQYVRPVCLPRSVRQKSLPKYALTDPESFPKTGVIAGWGITETGYLPKELNFARIPPIEESRCKQLYKASNPSGSDGIKITQNMICAGYPGKGKGRDSCQGDSGGPLMFKDPDRSKYYLSGVVSFGSTEKCGEGTFGIYTNVSRYISWIDNFIRD